jgi:DNA-binding protein H-NS
MALPSIDKLTYKQLLDLEKKIAAAIAKRKQEEKAELKRQITALAASSGFDVEEIVGGGGSRRGSRKGTKVAPKYQHPQDPSLTWSGRGRQPRWLVAELKKGKKIETFLIKD